MEYNLEEVTVSESFYGSFLRVCLYERVAVSEAVCVCVLKWPSKRDINCFWLCGVETDTLCHYKNDIK